MEKRDISHRVLTCYYRPKPGGFCTRYFRAISALLQRGHVVHYLAVVPFPITHTNCHFHRFPWPAKATENILFWIIFHILAPFFLLYLASRYRVDRLFAFGPSYGFLLQLVRVFRRVPLSIFLRADTVRNHQIKGHSRVIVWLDKLVEGIGLRCARVYGVSHACTDAVIQRHPKITVAKSGVFRNDVPQSMQSVSSDTKAPDIIRAACVGILEARKNQGFLVELFSKLPAGGIELHFYGVGSDKLRLVKRVDDQNLVDAVVFHDWVTPNKLWTEVDLLLMPSLHEGAPNSVLEAVARSIPVIASDIPEHREILPPLALAPLDIEIWAARLNGILQQPDIMLKALVDELEMAKVEIIFDWDGQIVERICAA